MEMDASTHEERSHRAVAPHDSNLSELIRRFNDSFMTSEGASLRSGELYIPSLEHIVLPPAELLKLMRNCCIPNFSVSVDVESGEQKITFEDVPDEVMSAFSGTLTTYDVSSKTHRFIHDFTFAHIATDMDVKISHVLGAIGDSSDDLSPDILDLDPERNVTLIEFTTTRSTTVSSIREAFKEKAAKYQPALSGRGDQFNRLLYGVIVVSPNRVMTNLPLSQEEVNVLCLRMNTAIEISKQLLNYTMEPDISDRKNRDREKVKQKLSEMKVNWDLTEKAFPHYTKEVYLAALEKPSMRNVLRCLVDTEQVTNRMLKEKVFHHLGSITNEQAIVENNERQEREIDNYWKDRIEEENQETIKSAKGEKGSKAPIHSSGKSIIGLPFWVLQNGTGSTSLKITPKIVETDMPYIGERDEDVVFKMIERAVMEVNKCKSVRFMESKETQERLAHEVLPEGVQEDLKRQRREYRRVVLPSTDEEKLELAKLGIDGKSFKDHPDVRMHRKDKQRPFSIDMGVDEIDQFLKECQSFFFTTTAVLDTQYDFCENMIALAKKAYSIHGDDVGNEWLDFLRVWMESNIGRWCNFVSAVGCELAAAMKQHVKRDEYIFKKLKDWDVYLLVKSTQSSKHTFFSLMCYNSSLADVETVPGNIFKKVKTNGTISWTEFHSINNHKLTNWVKCEPNMLSLIGYWINFFGSNIVEVDLAETQSSNIDECWKMFGLTLMISLEDKAVTEQIITLSRYVIMEGFVSFPMLPNPTKMLRKVPRVFRSRLQVWLHNRLLYCMRRVADKPFCLVQDGEGTKWENLFNMFTGTQLKEPMQLISLFYIGYLKNKDESAQGNAGGAMAEKIIEPELKLPSDPTNLGLGDPLLENIKFLEFHKSLCLMMTDCGMDLLKVMYGEGFRERIEEAILDALSELNLENLATLKASSNFCPQLEKDDPKSVYKRRRAVEAVRPLMDHGVHVFEVLEMCLKVVEGKGAMHIDLFKKAQHSSIREIYVLAFEERVVQSALECISRAICGLFPSETLTHPRHKAEIPSQHFRESIKACGKDHITVGTSDDAAQWNQGHMVTKFMQMLVRMTPSYMHSFIVRGMSMFDCKKMRMDEATLRALRNSRVEGFRAPIMEAMRKRYYAMPGSEDFKVTEPYSTFIRTSSGMMQGILHYTSSLWHTLLQEFLRGYFQKKMMALKFGNKRPHVSVMQSSDDSAVLVSFPKVSEYDDSQAMYTVAWLFEYKKHIGKLMGIYPSEKCTSNTLSLVEFNSEFYFHSDIVRPLFRWISAVNTISEADSLAARQEEMSSNLTAVVSGGGGFSLTAVCQLAQLLLHYRTLGSGSTSVFPGYVSHLLKMPDPSLGFFLLDHPFMAGVMGFKYNLYLTVKKTPVGKKYGAILDSIECCNPQRVASGRSERTLQITTSGSLVQSTCVHFGKKDKWMALIKKLNLPVDWRETLDKFPESLYSTPKTKEDLLLRIAVKMHSPGVISSLSTNDATVRIVASSVYILVYRIMTDLLSWYKTNDPLPERTSLLKNVSEQEMLYGDHASATTEQLHILFPNSADYEYAEDVGGRFQEVIFIPSERTRRICSTINLTDTEEIYTVNPSTLAAYKWFGQRPRMNIGDDLLESGWRLLVSNVKWMKDTPEETLNCSPFAHHTEIKTFLMNLTLKQRNVVISGAPVKKTGGLSNLVTVMCENHAPGRKIPNQYDVEKAQLSSGVRLVMHTVYYILNGPFTIPTKIGSISKVLRECLDISTIKTSRVSRRNILHAMQSLVRGEDVESTVQKITFARLGLIGGFTVRQRIVEDSDRRKHYVGLGIWEGRFQETSFRLYFWCSAIREPNVLLKVVMSDVTHKPQVLSCVSEICRSAGITNPEVFRMPNLMPSARTELEMFRIVDFKEENLRTMKGAIGVLDRNLEWKVTAEQISDLRLDVRGRTLSIKASMKHGSGGPRGEITLVSYVANKNDVLTNTPLAAELHRTKTFSKEPTKSWIKAGSLSLTTVSTIIGGIVEGKRLPGYDHVEFRKMLTHCLNSSLSRQGIYVTQAGTPISQELPEWAPTKEQLWREAILPCIEDMNIFRTAAEGNPAVKETLEEATTAIAQINAMAGILPDIAANPNRYFPQALITDDTSFGSRPDIDGTPVESRDHPWLDAFVSIALVSMGRKDLLRLIHDRQYHSENREIAMMIRVLRQEENVPYMTISRELPVHATGEDVENFDDLG
uniref:RNA-dependent RNA polymerase n=1 Tax=Piguzov virus TaxID=2707252 RepID=A0A6H0DKD5_9VIRU|nr:MAG: RNA-dependent RNA polymerase [Piguzov virus]